VLPGTGWELEQGQRVRVHLGTSEVLARATLMEGDLLREGEEGWVQLRLEEPLLARARDHLVLRSYSPVTTLGGGVVVEVSPRKRRALAPGEAELLRTRLHGAPAAALSALLEFEGWAGVPRSALPQQTGLSPALAEEAACALLDRGDCREVDGVLFSRVFWDRGERRILESLEEYHRQEPLRPGRPLEELRQALPGTMGPRLSEAVIQHLASSGRVDLQRGTAARAGYRPTLTQAQRELQGRIRAILEKGGLAPPNLREMSEDLGGEGEIEPLLRLMEVSGEVLALEDGLFLLRDSVRKAGAILVESRGGASDLGPADFREDLPLTRKHLLPLLRYFDTVGITTRRVEMRSVAQELPEGWWDPAGP